jgi:hypothetical protein
LWMATLRTCWSLRAAVQLIVAAHIVDGHVPDLLVLAACTAIELGGRLIVAGALRLSVAAEVSFRQLVARGR